jgi:hypothetical protein
MVPQTNYSSSTYSNNRNTATGWSYDADGRLLGSSDSGVNFSSSFDAASQLIASSAPGRTISQGLDGDGFRVKWVENNVTTYQVKSSALGGQTIVELDQSGNKLRGYVYGGGQEIAKHEAGQVLWDQRDVSGVSMRLTDSTGTVTSKVETDPLGTQVSDASEFNQNGGGSGYGFNPNGFYGDPTMPDMGCTEGNVPVSCNLVQTSLRTGGSYQCSGWTCPTAGWNPNREGQGQGGFFLYRYTDEGVMMDPIGGSQKPKNTATQVMAPIGGLDKMKSLLEQALNYSDCRDAMQKLLAQIGSDTNFAPSHTDILDLFNALRNQTGGGGIFVDVPAERLNDFLPEQARGEPVSGGGGVSNFYYTDPSNWRTRQRWSAVFVKSVYSDRPAFERLPYDYVLTLIHELTHNAPNDSSGYGLTYTHKQMDGAAKTLGTSAGFDQYVREHCIPQKYWIPQK